MDSKQEQEQKIIKDMLEKQIINTYNEMLKLYPEMKSMLDAQKKSSLNQIGIDYYEK